MPVMDGLTATKTIRSLKHQDADTIPIIAMTANAFKEDKEKCLAAGMNAHLAKPIEIENVKKVLGKYDGILVPGGFGNRGIEGMITAIEYVRENNIPFLGICLGMQMAVVEFARNVLKLEDVNSEEFNENAKNKVIHIMDEQKEVKKKGGTMRLGAYPCLLKENTKVKELYDIVSYKFPVVIY